MNSNFGKEKKRCETQWVLEELDVSYRFIIWYLLDSTREKMELDSEQVFILECHEGGVIYSGTTHKQKIIHMQQGYKKEYEFTSEYCVNGTICVIDNGETCTMMWKDEKEA